MKLSYALFFAAITSVDAKPVSSCEAQADCFKLSMTKVNSNLCDDDCEYKVCMTASLDEPCAKGLDPEDPEHGISHTCAFGTDSCASNIGSTDGSEPLFADGDVNCIIVGAGEVAEFVLKDGNAGCGAGTTTTVSGYSVSCAGSDDTCSGSSGNCVWSVTAPSACGGGGGGGDPHFRLWNGERVSYHGEGDFVLTRADNYASGAGMEVQIRTTINKFYSFIENAALRVGDDVFEVGMNSAWVNGKELNNEDFPVAFHNTVITAPEWIGKVKHFTVQLEDNDSVKIMVYKNFVSVKVNGDANFENAVGMLGDYNTGAKLARDGRTIMDELDAYGAEWQVRDHERMIFHVAREPQYPSAPRLPSETEIVAQRRILQSNHELLGDAEEACASKPVEDFDNCVFDVMATGDLDMAGAW